MRIHFFPLQIKLRSTQSSGESMYTVVIIKVMLHVSRVDCNTKFKFQGRCRSILRRCQLRNVSLLAGMTLEHHPHHARCEPPSSRTRYVPVSRSSSYSTTHDPTMTRFFALCFTTPPSPITSCRKYPGSSPSWLSVDSNSVWYDE